MQNVLMRYLHAAHDGRILELKLTASEVVEPHTPHRFGGHPGGFSASPAPLRDSVPTQAHARESAPSPR